MTGRMQEGERRPLALGTGAAGKLGRSIAVGLARRGDAIGLHYFHSEQKTRELQTQLFNLNVDLILLQADLREVEQVRSLFEWIYTSGFALEVLINSASGMAGGNSMEVSPQEWDNILNLNLCAAWFCVQQAGRFSEQRRSGYPDPNSGMQPGSWNSGDCSCIRMGLFGAGYF